MLSDKINDSPIYGVHRVLRRIEQGHGADLINLTGYTARECEHGIDCGWREYIPCFTNIAQMGMDIVLSLRPVKGDKGKSEVNALGDGFEYFLGQLRP